MAKLHFNHSVMNAGKSAQLLGVRFNYLDHGGKVMLFTSSTDDRGGVGVVSSRMGISAEAHALGPEENLFEIVERANDSSPEGVTAVMLDEVQFMTPEQVYQMSEIADQLDIPVMAYGLKNNAFGKLFSPAVAELLALADDIKEIKQVCHCGRKANLILKYDVDGTIVRGGEVVEIGGNDRYVSVCRSHWKSGDIGRKARKAVFEAGYGTRVICASCGTAHEAYGDDIEQGSGCAAKLTGRRVYGWYGSAVADMTEFKFEGDIPEDARQGMICDTCIRKHVASGALVEANRVDEEALDPDDQD